jgi:transcriptional regulator with XRE-family HTH domain
MATRVGARLKAVREKLGYARAQVAKQAGIDAAMLCRIENSANSAPTFETIRKLADVLEISLDWLAGGARVPPVGEQRLADVKRIQRIERALALLKRAVDELSHGDATSSKSGSRGKTP